MQQLLCLIDLMNSDTLTKATDQIEYEVENTQTTTNTSTTVSGAPDGSRPNRWQT